MNGETDILNKTLSIINLTKMKPGDIFYYRNIEL